MENQYYRKHCCCSLLLNYLNNRTDNGNKIIAKIISMERKHFF